MGRGAGSGRFDVTNPANGEVVGSMPDATARRRARAIDAAAGALEAWRNAAAIERARILRRSADLMRERVDEIGAVMTTEQGKPLAEAKGEVEYAASFFEWFAGEAERIYGQIVPPRTRTTACSCCARPSASPPRSRRGTSRRR